MTERVRITRMSKQDAYYDVRERLIGKAGTFDFQYSWGRGWYGGHFTLDDDPDRPRVFHRIQVKRLPEN